MVVCTRNVMAAACAAILLASIPASARVTLEIFAMKSNKFAEKSLYDRLTWDKDLKLGDRATAAFKKVFPDNRLFPSEIKKYPVVEVTGVKDFLKAYTSAKGWFNPTMKIFVKVAKDLDEKTGRKVLRLGFNESSVPLIAEEMDRLDRTLDRLANLLERKSDMFDQKAKNVEARLQAFSEDLSKEASERRQADDDLSGNAALYSALSGLLSFIVLLGLLYQAHSRKKAEELLKAQLEKGTEPTSYLKL